MARKRYDEVLNRIIWHPACEPKDFLVIYKHRGAPDDLGILRVSELARVAGGRLIQRRGSQIPLTRIVQIRNHRTGQILAGEELALKEALET
jgi:uncharacterized protein (UPF0248 family)